VSWSHRRFQCRAVSLPHDFHEVVFVTCCAWVRVQEGASQSSLRNPAELIEASFTLLFPGDVRLFFPPIGNLYSGCLNCKRFHLRSVPLGDAVTRWGSRSQPIDRNRVRHSRSAFASRGCRSSSAHRKPETSPIFVSLSIVVRGPLFANTVSAVLSTVFSR